MPSHLGAYEGPKSVLTPDTKGPFGKSRALFSLSQRRELEEAVPEPATGEQRKAAGRRGAGLPVLSQNQLN